MAWVKYGTARYAACHRKIDKMKGKPKLCEICGTVEVSKKYAWANTSDDYDNPNDFKRMCSSCHSIYDAARRRAVRFGSNLPLLFEIINKARLKNPLRIALGNGLFLIRGKRKTISLELLFEK